MEESQREILSWSCCLLLRKRPWPALSQLRGLCVQCVLLQQHRSVATFLSPTNNNRPTEERTDSSRCCDDDAQDRDMRDAHKGANLFFGPRGSAKERERDRSTFFHLSTPRPRFLSGPSSHHTQSECPFAVYYFPPVIWLVLSKKFKSKATKQLCLSAATYMDGGCCVREADGRTKGEVACFAERGRERGIGSVCASSVATRARLQRRLPPLIIMPSVCAPVNMEREPPATLYTHRHATPKISRNEMDSGHWGKIENIPYRGFSRHYISCPVHTCCA